MDTRIFYREGISVPQQGKQTEFAGPWMPPTPIKPIPMRSNPMPMLDNQHDNRLGEGNWQELVGFDDVFAPEMLNHSSVAQPHFRQIDQFGRNGSHAEKNGLINHIAGSYTQALLDENKSWNYNPLADISAVNNTDFTVYPNRSSTSTLGMPFIPNLNATAHSRGESNSSELSYGNQVHCPSSSPNLLNSQNSFQTSQYGSPIPYYPGYNLNSPSSVEADAASTVTNSFQFASVVQQPMTLDNQLSSLNFPLIKASGKERDKQEDILVSIGDVPNQQETLLHNIVDSSSVVISTFEEPKDSYQGCDQVTDLNKTPQQKTPKRKKHRPKVIVERKTKKTPSTATLKKADPKAKEKKYVRKKGQQESATQNPDSVGKTMESIEKPKGKRKHVNINSMKEQENQNATYVSDATYAGSGPAALSCRRALDFETETMFSEREKILLAQQKRSNKNEQPLNLKTQAAESLNGPATLCGTKSDFQMRQQNTSLFEILQLRGISKLTPTNQITNNIHSISEKREHGVQPSARNNGIRNNFLGSGRDINVGMLQQIRTEEIGRPVFPAKTNFKSFNMNERTTSLSAESVTKIPTLTGGKRYKKEYYHEEMIRYSTGSSLGKSFCREGLQQRDYPLNSCSYAPSLETPKKQKTEHGIQNSTNGTTPLVAASNQSRVRNSNKTNSSASVERNRELFNLYWQINNTPNGYIVDQCQQSVASGRDLSMQHKLDGLNSFRESIGENCSIIPPTPPRVLTQSPSVPLKTSKMLQAQTDILTNQHSTAKTKGQSAKQKFTATVEEIIYRMKHLNINVVQGELPAIVPYKGDGTLVPYGGIEFLKKRKPRPKVDLDPVEETDTEKKEWWEEQRTVFRGRADSFIARMHLVQGDRRFTKWKGSVVDSVIGVFLTQNVSDHLSSSAFMHLVAKFPPKSMRNGSCEEKIILVQEPVFYMPNQNSLIKWHGKSSTPFYNNTLETMHEPVEQQRDHENSWIERVGIKLAHTHSPEEVFSSQNSFNSSVVQSNAGVRSYSGSNSEAEDPAIGCKNNRNHSASNLQNLDNRLEEYFSPASGRSFHEGSKHGHRQPEDIEDRLQWPRLDRLDDSQKGSSTVYRQNYSNLSQLQTEVFPSSNSGLYMTQLSRDLEVEHSHLYREESIFSWPSSSSRVGKERDENCTSTRVLQRAECLAKYGSENNQEISIENPYAFARKQIQYGLKNPQADQGSQQHDVNKTFCFESIIATEPVNLADIHGYRQSSYGQPDSGITKPTEKVYDVEDGIALVESKQTDSENKFTESVSKEKVNCTNEVNLSTNSSKPRNGKAKSGKKDTVDWDSLRKEVLENGRQKERSEDAMDSLDYEVMRNADVDEISDTIKERGMNNLLAERIKEFLNRLIREHGSIDLEWLRDIPPDKAKEYLLSIRGLGLKSVECVRLLTLHHRAFPVDTNVGRIAVRLGWVPLQPLPESLQLHLLELYPILESIQKYLWPRLCKLDQRTLYELHYQMITFGKVFCTKNRPNCNACPMRAECRHFASAFASARLALPGPEDKSIVTTTVPITTDRRPGIVIDPMPLPPAEENALKIKESEIVSCVPIIEEPATPEQESTELIECDMEDIFDEDPDDIPTIKLNMEELTSNLQNYMQANTDLQEFDMSKALVALHPAVASIPTPKQKNISRLRTEHQVYELPDSHPLLKGMDKREADDPSPYLLAIWTPGETVNSIQAPEQNCQFQGSGKLCNEETCFSCNSIREANKKTVRGTLLIPCRTAMRGSFPLNGTYFQVNEVFADHRSSLNPIDVPRDWIWNLPRRMVYFGTSVSTIFKGLPTEEIQHCFWKGFVCVRGFDQKTRAPKPLIARLHFPASKLSKTKNEAR